MTSNAESNVTNDDFLQTLKEMTSILKRLEDHLTKGDGTALLTNSQADGGDKGPSAIRGRVENNDRDEVYDRFKNLYSMDYLVQEQNNSADHSRGLRF